MDKQLTKEILWRLNDIREMLMERGVGGDRLYGCDEWSTPILNINSLIKIIEENKNATLHK